MASRRKKAEPVRAPRERRKKEPVRDQFVVQFYDDDGNLKAFAFGRDGSGIERDKVRALARQSREQWEQEFGEALNAGAERNMTYEEACALTSITIPA